MVKEKESGRHLHGSGTLKVLSPHLDVWLCADRQVLALKSEVFCGICESAPSGTGPENKLHIPLPDCSSKEARIFLDFIYNNTPVSDPLAAESLTKVRSSQAILHSSTALVCLILLSQGCQRNLVDLPWQLKALGLAGCT